MPRWMIATVAGFFVIYTVVVLATGEPTYLIPVVVLAVIAVAFAYGNRALAQRQLRKHGGDVEAALADNEDPVPSAPQISDDDRPLGDTPEAHDEISPHDIPKYSLARNAAEAQVGGERGATRGNEEGAAGGEHSGPVHDGTGERVGDDGQRSAERAK